MVNQLDISIVVPVYNSEHIIQAFVERTKKTFRDINLTYELILCDDCSTDNSWHTIKAMSKEHGFIKAHRNESNLGQLKTTMFGISQANGKYIVTIDDDLEYNPEDIVILYHTLIEKDLDVLFGIAKEKYIIKGKSKFISNLRNCFLNFLLRKPQTDSFKIFKRNFVFNGEEFLLSVPFESYLSKKIDSVRIDYIDVEFNSRFEGNSNYSLQKKIKMLYQLITSR